MREYFQTILRLCFAYDRRIKAAPQLMTQADCDRANALYEEMHRLQLIEKGWYCAKL